VLVAGQPAATHDRPADQGVLAGDHLVGVAHRLHGAGLLEDGEIGHRDEAVVEPEQLVHDPVVGVHRLEPVELAERHGLADRRQAVERGEQGVQRGLEVAA
jgi:hypothetical protein